MSGWAAVRARKVVASLRLEKWDKGSPCPESLAEVQLSCLLEVEELQEWSVSKLAGHWGWGRKKARRLLVGWASWFESNGPRNGRTIPAWVLELGGTGNSEGTDQAQAGDGEGTGATQEEGADRDAEEQVGHRGGTEQEPRARSSSIDIDQPEPQTKTDSGFEKPEVLSSEGQGAPEFEIYREWEARYRDFRNRHAKRQRADAYTPTAVRIQAVRRALRTVDPETGQPYLAADLVLLVRYAFEAPPGAPDVDWWRRDRGHYLGIENLMVADKLPKRMQAARDWEVGDLSLERAVLPGRIHGGSGSLRGAYRAGGRGTRPGTPVTDTRSFTEQDEAFERKKSQLSATCRGAA